jgi:hypothetical protein
LDLDLGVFVITSRRMDRGNWILLLFGGIDLLSPGWVSRLSFLSQVTWVYHLSCSLLGMMCLAVTL